MFAIFKREFRAGFKPTVFWALGVLVLVASSFWKYGGLAAASDATNAITSVMPHVVQVMFGMTLPVNTPQGYFVCICLWTGIAVFLHAALLGASIIGKEEQGNTADFLLVRPLSRAKVVAAKSLAGALQVIIVNADRAIHKPGARRSVCESDFACRGRRNCQIRLRYCFVIQIQRDQQIG